MAVPTTPTPFYVTTANQQVLAQWGITAGATSYTLQRSADGVTYTTIASPAATSYLDTTVSINTQYYYQVAATNGSGSSNYTVPQSVIPSPTAEFSLAAIRLAAQQRADLVGSNFLTLPEWNQNINQAQYELYDILIGADQEYFMAPRARFNVVANQFIYPLPNGTLSFTGMTGSTFVAAPFYKLLGVDLALNTAMNAFVNLDKYNFQNRNDYVYPNSNSTIYGVFNLSYRVMGSNIELIPTPTPGQVIQLCYIPRLPELLQDTDTTTVGISGWIEYVIVRAAKYALDKQNIDSSKLDAELSILANRIEESAINRDIGRPDTITNVRRWGNYGTGNLNGFGSGGGWAALPLGLLPVSLSYHSTNSSLINAVNLSQFSLIKIASLIVGAYFFNLSISKFSSRVSFSGVRNFITSSIASFFNHIRDIVKRSSKEQVVRIDTPPIITLMADEEAVRDVSIMNLPANSVSPIIIPNAVTSTRSIASNLSDPLPTSIRAFFVNLLPKSILVRLHKHIVCTIREESQ